MSLITREDAIIIHFHAKRKVNPEDPTDIEWIETPPVILLPFDALTSSEILDYILENIDRIEHMRKADWVTHEHFPFDGDSYDGGI